MFYEVITESSIRSLFSEPKLIEAIASEDWRAPLMAFINGFYEPEAKTEQNRMQQRAWLPYNTRRVVQMPKRSPWKRAPLRISLQHLWLSHQCLSSGRKGHKVGFLLDDNGKGCKGNSKNMQSMPEEVRKTLYTITVISANHASVDTSQVGNGHRRTAYPSAGRLQLHN